MHYDNSVRMVSPPSDVEMEAELKEKARRRPRDHHGYRGWHGYHLRRTYWHRVALRRGVYAPTKACFTRMAELNNLQ